MQQAITGFHLDEEGHWVAELACRHQQHVRHDPPWQNRPWTQTEAGRQATLGQLLNCRKCDAGAPPERVFSLLCTAFAAFVACAPAGVIRRSRATAGAVGDV